MVVASISKKSRGSESRAGDSAVATKLAVLAGSAGAAVAGEALAAGITYVPTSGVASAQGIPGFSFTAPLTVTSGTLRPPSSAGNNGWDVDGNGQNDFNLQNNNDNQAFLIPRAPFAPNPNGLLLTSTSSGPEIRNLANAAPVGPSAVVWDNNGQAITFNAFYNMQDPGFTPNQPGYFGFRFAFGSNPNQYYYGWASLTIDFSTDGEGYKITEAFYQSTPNTAINVGAVPVPEPSGVALLAAGAAGVTAWRARRKKLSVAE